VIEEMDFQVGEHGLDARRRLLLAVPLHPLSRIDRRAVA
jgi:hypothetical protein